MYHSAVSTLLSMWNTFSFVDAGMTLSDDHITSLTSPYGILQPLMFLSALVTVFGGLR